MSDCFPSFELVRRAHVASLQLEVAEYRHCKTGASHFHLAAAHDENVFLVALRTLPSDSTGVAHILEHTVLCGSRRFPVRDPFFLMLRRSLNTFMNAVTTSDATAFPFASQNRKDFDNLLQVYLDAVFFASLDEFDFQQEGHRVELADPRVADSPLVRKGVVLNEMLGAMSSPVTQLAIALNAALFPTTVYRNNCGGDPARIPDLTYDGLRQFYRSHYHPSNAIFLTFGNIPAAAHQARFEELALHAFDASPTVFEAGLERRFAAPRSVEEPYAWHGAGDATERCHVVLAWLLGDAADVSQLLQAHLLTSVLLDNSASPLRHALETAGLGSAPSPLMGLEDAQREMIFACGVEGARREDAAAVEQLVLKVLHQVAVEGVPADAVASSLHQLELAQREIGGDGQPFGLQLMMQMLPSAIHRGDALAALNLDPALVQLAADAQAADFVPKLVRRLLLDNPHRVRLCMVPDPGLANRRRADDETNLAKQAAALSAAARAEINARADALAARQARPADVAVLPRLSLEDVPAAGKHPTPAVGQLGAGARLGFDAPTNGLVYCDVVYSMPALPQALLFLLPVYEDLLPELGAGEFDYQAMQAWQARACGGLDVQTSLRGAAAGGGLSAYLAINAKGLARNCTDITRLLFHQFDAARWDELVRIRELLAQARADAEESVVEGGHRMAMAAAAAGVSPAGYLAHQFDGMAGVQRLFDLDQACDAPEQLRDVAEQLADLHQRLRRAPYRLMAVSEPRYRANVMAELDQVWPAPSEGGNPALLLPFQPRRIAEAWIVPADVSFCAAVYPTVPFSHLDAPSLTVLGVLLRNAYLHRVIREQGGAYGSGAGQDNDQAAFRFFSYRDPRIEGTFSDFDRAVAWIIDQAPAPRDVEEAILGVIGSLDKPGSPAGEARQTYYDALHGRSPEARQAYRAAVLQVSASDLQRVAATYLKPELVSRAVLTGERNAATCADMGFEVMGG